MNADDVDYIVTRVESRLGTAWRGMLRQVKNDLSLMDVESAIRADDLDLLVGAIESAAERYAAEVAAGYVRAAQRTSRWLDENIDGPMMRFDLTDSNAIEWMQAEAQGFVRTFVAEQRDVANQVIANARTRGVSDRIAAQDVLESLGLAPAHIEYVETYRRALQVGDYENLLSRELGDGRYDRALINAREAGTFISENRQESMLSRYRDNWVKARGETFARKEAANAVHAGIAEAIDQGVRAKDLMNGNVIQQWNTRGDARVRASHQVMDGQQRDFGELFDSGLGQLAYPGDSAGSAEDTCNCRCVLSYEIVGIAKRSTFRMAS